MRRGTDRSSQRVAAGARPLCQLLLNPGDSVLIEKPHYQGYPRRSSGGGRAAGTRTRGRARPRRHCSGVPTTPARLICVTPSHQFPDRSGNEARASPGSARMGRAAQRVHRRGRLRRGVPLRGPARGGRPSSGHTRGTIYVGTLSKVLFPALRIGFVVLPRSLVALFRVGKWIADRHSPTLEQSRSPPSWSRGTTSGICAV